MPNDTHMPRDTAETPRVASRMSRRTILLLMAAGAIGAAVVSRVVYGGDIVFPALMGACFGLAVAATGQRRMRIGAEDVRSIKMQQHYADVESTKVSEADK